MGPFNEFKFSSCYTVVLLPLSSAVVILLVLIYRVSVFYYWLVVHFIQILGPAVLLSQSLI